MKGVIAVVVFWGIFLSSLMGIHFIAGKQWNEALCYIIASCGFLLSLALVSGIIYFLVEAGTNDR